MNKNIVIYAAIAVSVIVAGFILFSGNENFENQYASLKSNGDLSKVVDKDKQKEIEVKYQATAKKEEPKKEGVKPTREKFVESKTLDASKKFEISLINEQTWDSTREAASFVGIAGKIDNSPFGLTVPSYLITDSSEVKIKIKNTQTGEEKTLFAPFIKDLTLRSGGNSLNINSNDASNYSFEQKPSVLPGPSDIPPSLPSN